MWNKGWDKIFEKNEWGRYPSLELVRFIARNFRGTLNRKKVKILEVGSGTGANLWYMAREGFDVTGIDGSSIGIRRSLKRLKDEGLKAKVKKCDATKMPFNNNSFDCVIDNECIYANSYKDSEKIIAEIHRVLKPGGKFYSKTFMAGSAISAFKKGYGVARLTDKSGIKGLYGNFDIESLDYVIRSDKNRKCKIKEWVIICSKSKAKRK